MSEGNFDSNNQLQEPLGADAYALENLREKILHKIDDLQDEGMLSKVWSLLSEVPAEQKPFQLLQHKENIFEAYHEVLTKLAQ